MPVIRESLTAIDRVPSDWGARTGVSAVLVPLVGREESPRVLLTRRADTLRHHSGEISFPGGRSEPGDRDALATALRETEEETGIAPGMVDALGLLHPVVTAVSNMEVHPVVGHVPDLPDLRPHPDEVAEILVVDLAELAFGGCHRRELWRVDGEEREVHFFTTSQGHVIWGATARMLVDLFMTAATAS
ncbi:MAG: hypothetical protein KatS3mg008_1074 [Acidimicrobiales bacterium]|nr:MAG: hypothetical protein KatS3mg008_1074 [Acidimicrobiales bacterium]